MSSLSDLSNSIKSSITDKVTHPLLGSFIISWFFFNWKAVYFICFSNLNATYKIKSITENYSDWCLNLFTPLISSLVLVFLLPLFTAAYTRFIAYTKEFQMKSLPEFFKPHSLTLEDSNSLRDFYETEFTSLNKELSKANKTITNYRTRDEGIFKEYKGKINNVFDLLAAVKLDENILKVELGSSEIDKIKFLEQFLSSPVNYESFYPNSVYILKNSNDLSTWGFEEDLIESEDGNNNKVNITRKGVEELSNLKFEALKKHYGLNSANSLNGRGLH
ncbi:hypothetical protein [Pseudoalteromonas sp. NSLLW218]|uniref:hypothetical protein n=1 Tax=Pseudoalteromonas sp. NSLLW218 TaxID=2792048 RepID=UPI0018CF0076|nr:hypothetical protein [Pseudoalteromonas sp. NSLLW218]MBH0089747.1 hypothetical protein [Pseudoalteromonas sp. NSLLW218]